MPLPLLPDVVDVTITALLAQPAVTALVSTRIYGQLPATPTWPLLVVSTVDDDEGGDPYLGLARVQVDCWGAGPSAADVAQARLLARSVRSVARDLKGTYAGGTITGAAPALFLAQPDPQTGRARFVVDLNVESHA